MALITEWECPDCGLVLEEDRLPQRCPGCGGRGDLFECFQYEGEDEWDEELEDWVGDECADPAEPLDVEVVISLITDDLDDEPLDEELARQFEAELQPPPPDEDEPSP